MTSLALVPSHEAKPPRANSSEEASVILRMQGEGMSINAIAKAIGGRRTDTLKRIKKVLEED